MRAGTLRHVVTIQSPGGARDAVGERTTTWTDVATAYAQIERLSGAEAFRAAQRQATSTHLITLRYDPALAAIDASWRIAYGARIFTIDEPPDDVELRAATFQLYCTEGRRTE